MPGLCVGLLLLAVVCNAQIDGCFPDGNMIATEDCRMYAECVGGVYQLRTCAAGTAFNTTTSYCSDPLDQYEECPPSQRSNIQFGCTPYVIYGGNCSQYVECDQGREVVKSCGIGTIYNENLRTCDWPLPEIIRMQDCTYP